MHTKARTFSVHRKCWHLGLFRSLNGSVQTFYVFRSAFCYFDKSVISKHLYDRAMFWSTINVQLWNFVGSLDSFDSSYDEISLKSILNSRNFTTRMVGNKFIKIQISFWPRDSLINSIPKRYKTNIRFIIVRWWSRRDVEKKVKKPKLWIILNRHTEIDDMIKCYQEIINLLSLITGSWIQNDAKHSDIAEPELLRSEMFYDNFISAEFINYFNDVFIQRTPLLFQFR